MTIDQGLHQHVNTTHTHTNFQFISLQTYCDSDGQYWQLGGPKFGPTRYPAYRSIHRAHLGLG